MNRTAKAVAVCLVVMLGVPTAGPASALVSGPSTYSTVTVITSKTTSGADRQPKFVQKFNAKKISRLAMTNFNRYVKANKQKKPRKVVFQDGFTFPDRQWMNKLARDTVNALPFQPGFVPLIVIAGSDEFINEALRSDGKSGNSAAYWCGRPTEREAYCAGSGWAGLNYKDSLARGFPIQDPGRRSAVAHEIFHVWHKTVDGSYGKPSNVDPRLPNGIPVWFAEGNANFFGYAMAQTSIWDNYFLGRESQVDRYMLTSSRPLREYIFWDTNPYGIGQAAAEYLVASVGMQRVLNVYINVGSGSTFAAAFEQGIGLPLEDFYNQFESVRANFTKR